MNADKDDFPPKPSNPLSTTCHQIHQRFIGVHPRSSAVPNPRPRGYLWLFAATNPCNNRTRSLNLSGDCMTPTPTSPTSNSGHSLFPATRWSVVVAAQDAASPDAAAALNHLCQTYWYPLYVYVRRSGRNPDDAMDLTQAFFARVLEKGYLRTADREKGRLRTFLVVLLKRFLANEWDRQNRLRRGAGIARLPFDTQLAEKRFATEPSNAVPSDAAYDRRWALTLLDRTMQRLAADYQAGGRGRDFELLKTYLAADGASLSYGEIAQKLGVNEGAARTAVHRLRKRFREIFRDEIAQTVSADDDIDAEVRHLVEVLAQEGSR